MDKPLNRTIRGLLRLLADEETAVQVVSFTKADGTSEDTFDAMRPGVDYWPIRDLPAVRTDSRGGLRGRVDPSAERIKFVNTSGTIALMFPSSWTYQSDDDGNEIIATRQNREGGDRLVIRLHQPNVLAANWSASLEPDRIEE